MPVCKMLLTVEEMKDRQKWLNCRKNGIGGSDAASIVNLSPWKSKFALWAEKTGQIEEEEKDEAEQSEYVYWGNKLEQLVAERFCELTGKKVRKQGLLQNIDNPWMLASVDRVIVGENAGLECKTASSWKAEEWDNDEIPANYIVQCLHYLLVTGYERWYIAVLIGGNDFRWKCIERYEVEEELEQLRKAEEDFWINNVLANKAPDIDGTESSSKALATMYKGDDEADAEELEGEFDTDFDDLAVLKDELSKLKKVIESKKNKIKARMGNALFGRSPRYNVWYKVLTRKGYDTQALARDFPDIAKKYETTTAFRKLDVRISKARTQQQS